MKLKFMLTLLIGASLLIACESQNDTTEAFETHVDTTTSQNSEDLKDEQSLLTEQLEDGIYYAQSSDYSTQTGYKEFVIIQVIDQEIASIELDAVSSNAQQLLTESVSTTESETLSINEQLEVLKTYLLQNTTTNIPALAEDTTKDFTINCETYIELYTQALSDAPIEKGPYQDGYYVARASEFLDQEKPIVFLTVKHGYIIAVNWDTQLEGSTKTMKQLAKDNDEAYANWYEQTIELEQHLIEIQNPSLITYDEDNMTTALDDTCPFIHLFVELTIQALGAGPLIK